MMLHMILVTEILAIIICIHCIYGEKVKLDVKTVGAILGILIIMEIANALELGGIFLLSGYIVLFLYCKSEFKCSVVEAIISLLLCIIIISSMQFICISLVNIAVPDKHLVRNLISYIFVLIICVGILPKCGLHQLQRGICKRSRQVVMLLAFMGLIVILLLVQDKLFQEIQMQYFVFAIPLIFMLLYLIGKWYTTWTAVERKEEEIHKVEDNAKEYEKLLTKVRLRQHEFKNHMAAIFSSHYTHKTYDELVQAQEAYCNKLLSENKYNNLLLLGDNTLVGYLYGKFQEAEAAGIEINYKVAAKVDKPQVPTYYIIEMLGILFDNAVEALQVSEEKIISFEVCEVNAGYEFSVKNSFPYVSYDEISEWFKYEKSEKGSERGLGLYHLRCLCEEWKCDIGCRNIEIDKKNWIVFTLRIGKADDK